MKKYAVFMLALLWGTILTGCSDKTPTKISSEIDKIKIVTAMGNPKYGADSKTITNVEEIELFLETFNNAKLGDKVRDDDIGTAIPSHYYFYFADKLIAKFTFNGNNSNIIWFNNSYHYIDYDDKLKSPYELYENSTAEIIVLDENGKEMTRPID